MDVIQETAADMHADFLNQQDDHEIMAPQESQKFKQSNNQATSSTGEIKAVKRGAAIEKIRQIAQDIYESTKGISDEIPKHTSKILQNVKGDKKGKGGQGGSEQIKYTKYEAWEKMYYDKLQEYKEAKKLTDELSKKLHEKNEMYITREETYNAVIQELN